MRWGGGWGLTSKPRSAIIPIVLNKEVTMSELISVKEAAHLLEVTTRWVNELITRGLIEARKVGSQWVVSKESVLDYLEAKK